MDTAAGEVHSGGARGWSVHSGVDVCTQGCGTGNDVNGHEMISCFDGDFRDGALVERLLVRDEVKALQFVG
jgi:hypothetical protein